MKNFILSLLAIIFLTGCFNFNWTVDTDLTDAEHQKYKDTILEYKGKIKNYEPADEFATPEPPIPYWVELARAQEGLGKLGDALKTYEDAKEIYQRSQAIEHNIGRLYEEAKEYEKAVEQYLYIVEEFQNDAYLYDITWAYIRAKDRQNAEKYFNAWQLALQKTDGQTQQAIKKLRDAEE